MTTLDAPSPIAPVGLLTASPAAFDDIPRRAWDRLFSASPMATPFSRWTFHRAWWDAYDETAQQRYLLVAPGLAALSEPDDIRAIVPLMRRRERDHQDMESATHPRRSEPEGADLPRQAWAIFMGASYHADYATVLADPADLDAVAQATVAALAGLPLVDPGWSWDAIDLRRLRHGDPVLDALLRAFTAAAPGHGWSISTEIEDVCPVAHLASDWKAYLAGLGKKDRHEIRRKLRRAHAAGSQTLHHLSLGPDAVERFIGLHQARWGDEGLFPPTRSGDRGRRFFHRLAALEAAEPDPCFHLAEVRVGDRAVFAISGFDDGRRTYFYNAGMDPAAADLSPGVIGTAAYVRDRLEAGRLEVDFLRGDEPYKYQWGAVDEPIHRLVVSHGSVPEPQERTTAQ